MSDQIIVHTVGNPLHPLDSDQMTNVLLFRGRLIASTENEPNPYTLSPCPTTTNYSGIPLFQTAVS